MSWQRLSMAFAFCLVAFPAKAEHAMWVIKDSDSTIYLIGYSVGCDSSRTL